MSNLSKLALLASPPEVAKRIALREKARRRKLGITQSELAGRSGVSLGSLRRFEQTGQVSLESLVRLARALGCEGELGGLFSAPAYRSIALRARADAWRARLHVPYACSTSACAA